MEDYSGGGLAVILVATLVTIGFSLGFAIYALIYWLGG